jgi:pimeloyl-ACP methyl ester carboxylesterase
MPRFVKLLALLFVSLMCVSQTVAQSGGDTAQKQGVVLSSVPRQVDTSARYLFYISGYIVAAGNTRPTSPRFGVYEYEQILESFRQRGFVVISEARKQSTEIEPYAMTVAPQVDQLLKAGVPPQNITVVGASQGSWIAMLVSTYTANRYVNFVFIAACSADDGLMKLVDLHGNVLFISERTDLPGSCERFRADAKGIRNYRSIQIKTGLKHGFLYRPMKEWIEPAIEWAQQTQ